MLARRGNEKTAQIILGIICLVLNVLTAFLSQTAYNPLFLDTIFIVTASFFGWISGLITAGFVNLFTTILRGDHLSGLWFALCSISFVVIIRLYLHKKDTINFLDKAITTLLGYLIYLGADKFLKNRINKNLAE